MTSNLYSLKDLIAEYHTPPFVANNDTTAIRIVEQLVKRKQGNIGEYPEHFHLFRVGSFDDYSANIEPCFPELVAQCSNMIPKDLGDIVSPDLAKN